MLILLAAAIVAALSFAGMADGGSLGDRVKNAVDALFGPSPSGATPAAPRGPGVWLRYTTLSKFVTEAEVNGFTIGELFQRYAQDLGGVVLGTNTTLRDAHPSEGGAVDVGDSPVMGRTYIASVRKEDKGN